MNKKGELTLIALSVVLVLFLGGLSFQLLKNDSNSITGNLISNTERGCLAHPDECAAGTYCDPTTKLCTRKKDWKIPCSNNIECKSGRCADSFLRINGNDVPMRICIGPFDNGQGPCDGNALCKSGYCNPSTKKCATKITTPGMMVQVKQTKANGVSCKLDNECSSSYCSLSTKKCAAKITTPGIALANRANGATCTAGNQCKSKLCTKGKCVECVTKSDCGVQSVCYNNKCFRTEGTTKDCTLYYNKGKANQERVKGTNDPHIVASVPDYSDVCINGTVVLQYYCNGTTKFYSQLTTCAAQEECKEGACVAKAKGLR